MISPASGIADRTQALMIDLAALAYALHGSIRPAALLPSDANSLDPFVQVARRIEFESGRLIQAQIAFLKSRELSLLRDAISLALEGRHTQVRKFWRDMLADLGVSEPESRQRTFPSGTAADTDP